MANKKSSCENCLGRGFIYDPNDPPDPVEGYKLVNKIKCKCQKLSLDKFSSNDFKELRNLHEQLCEGFEEKKKINVEIEVVTRYCLNENCDISSDEAHISNEYKTTKKSGNQFSARFLIDHLEEMSEPLIEASAAQKKAYKDKLAKSRKKFAEVAKSSGIPIRELYGIVAQNLNFREARKSIG